MKQARIAAGLGMLLLASTAHAFWGFGESKEEKQEEAPKTASPNRRYHLSVPDSQTEQELLSLFNARNKLSQDIAVLRRLIHDRAARVATVDEALKKEFGVEQSAQYRFDVESGMLSKAVTAPGSEAGSDEAATVSPADESMEGAENAADADEAEGAATAETAFEPFKKLGKDSASLFLDLTASKRKRLREVAVLQGIQREQQANLNTILEHLQSKFGLQPGKIYDYEKATMKLYEIVPPRGARAVGRRGTSASGSRVRR